jgi:hypothetical protein
VEHTNGEVSSCISRQKKVSQFSVLSFRFWLLLSALGTSWFENSISRIDFRFLLSPLNRNHLNLFGKP